MVAKFNYYCFQITLYMPLFSLPIHSSASANSLDQPRFDISRKNKKITHLRESKTKMYDKPCSTLLSQDYTKWQRRVSQGAAVYTCNFAFKLPHHVHVCNFLRKVVCNLIYNSFILICIDERLSFVSARNNQNSKPFFVCKSYAESLGDSFAESDDYLLGWLSEYNINLKWFC